MSETIAFHGFQSQEDLTARLAEQVLYFLGLGIKENGRASLVVSGGSTPVPLFRQLSSLEFDWKHVQIGLVDERWVAPDQDDSNEYLVRTHLLQNRAAAATFTGMKNSAATPHEGERVCELELQKIDRPFDVLILGMGTDGHTASLFPGCPELLQATNMQSNKICMGMTPVTARHKRMSLTLPILLDSRTIFLHINGEEKKEVLEQALAEGPMETMPIRFILKQQQTPVNIYWAP